MTTTTDTDDVRSPGGLPWARVRDGAWEARVAIGPFALLLTLTHAPDGTWVGQVRTDQGRRVATVAAATPVAAVAQVEAAALLARADLFRAVGGGETPRDRWSVGDLLWVRREADAGLEVWQTYRPDGTLLQVWRVGRWAWAGEARDAGGHPIACVAPQDTWSDAVAHLEAQVGHGAVDG